MLNAFREVENGFLISNGSANTGQALCIPINHISHLRYLEGSISYITIASYHSFIVNRTVMAVIFQV
jgi:hypothetical protein